MALQGIVEQTVTGMGYELVEIERSAGGLLRVTIDWPWTAGSPRSITVDDCEKVTRQLQFALEVDAVDYRRLEVSSPGLDRPLRDARDFERFAGEVVDITLKAPIGAAAMGGTGSAPAVAGGAGVPPAVAANRKRFRGRLERVESGGEGGPVGWRIVWSDEPAPKPGQRMSKKRVPAPLQALDFTLDEVREARLAPIVDFKGRSGANAEASAG